jgi:DNA-binding response OmpR family regulator/anti-sigma regulatory factor (Ser/Thr protein kinase)
LERKSIKVNFESQIENYAVVDLRMAESIVRNLLSNAIKYSSEGGRIDIKVSQDEDYIKLSVRDYGVGMSAETINRLLNEDKQISTLGTCNEQGSGLGFQIVKEFVGKLNGKLRILSANGEGCEIEIMFVKSQNELKKNEKQELGLSYVNYSLDKESYSGSMVLLVDDDHLTLEYVRSLLIPYVQVKVATNGVEALDLAFKINPDIILSDVDMPLMDGIQLLKEVRNVTTFKSIPFIFLSAKDEDKVRFVGLSHGALDYITKPFKEEELIMKLFNLLDFKRKQQQQFLLNSLKEEVVVEELDPLLKKLMTFISENYSNSELSLDELASEMSMSKSTLSRRLKALMDKTPIEILVEYRLYKSRDLLKNSKDTIAEIAQKVGFNDPLYFSKKYKAFFGYSPSENR